MADWTLVRDDQQPERIPGWMPMTDIVHIRKLRRLGNYRLKLWFTDGQAGEWNFSGLAKRPRQMVEPFKDPA